MIFSPRSDDDAARLAAMLASRRLEEAAAHLYGLGATAGDLRLSIGQEAAAVGLARALGPADALFVGRRHLAHACAAGVAPERILTSLTGGDDALAAARFDASDAASALWRALGWTAARHRAGGGAVAVLDDLDVETGATLDALRYARANDLAVALVIEDARRDAPCPRLPDDIAVAEADGLDVRVVEAAVRALLEQVATERRCRALVLHVGRHRGFSMADPDRRKERGEDRRPRGVEDAIARERARLIAAGVEEEALEEIDEAARERVADALAARDRAAAAARLAARRGAQA